MRQAQEIVHRRAAEKQPHLAGLCRQGCGSKPGCWPVQSRAVSCGPRHVEQGFSADWLCPWGTRGNAWGQFWVSQWGHWCGWVDPRDATHCFGAQRACPAPALPSVLRDRPCSGAQVGPLGGLIPVAGGSGRSCEQAEPVGAFSVPLVACESSGQFAQSACAGGPMAAPILRPSPGRVGSHYVCGLV